MATRIWGGIAGWLLGIAPLLVVNAVVYFGIYYFPDPFLAGAIALLAGLLLGGVVAGLIGGRSSRTGGGASGAASTGLVAAGLYAVSVIGLMEAARIFDAPLFALTEHPIRVSVGVLFFAALLLLVALVTGTLAGTSVDDATAPSAQPSRPRVGAGVPRGGYPSGPAYGQPPYAQPRYSESAPASRPAGPPRSGPRNPASATSDPRYAGTRAYGPASRPARRSDSNPQRR